MNNSITRKVIYPNKIPYNAIFVVLFSILISILAYKNPMLYELFYEKLNPELRWSWLTKFFLHGTGDLNSMASHLFGNIVLGTIVFGYLIENVLGTGKAFLYTLFSMIFTLFFSYASSNFGHGASSITYSYFAFGIFICLEYIKRFNWKVIKKPFFILILLFTSYSIIGNISLYLSNNNFGGRNSHTISFIVGIILSIIWSKDIKRYFNSSEKTKYKYTSNDKISIIMILIMSFYLCYSIFVVNQELANRQLLKDITKDIGIPQTRQELNANSGQIVIRFEEEMLPIIHEYYSSISVNSIYIPSFKWKWLDTQTLYVRIHSPLGNDVNEFQIYFDKLRTINCKSIETINLQY